MRKFVATAAARIRNSRRTNAAPRATAIEYGLIAALISVAILVAFTAVDGGKKLSMSVPTVTVETPKK